jgi:hypothetical protein
MYKTQISSSTKSAVILIKIGSPFFAIEINDDNVFEVQCPKEAEIEWLEY